MKKRFASLDHAPAEARRLLCERLSRYLPPPHIDLPQHPGDTAEFLPDETMLDLLQHVVIVSTNDLVLARQVYEAARSDSSHDAEWDDIVATGRLRVVWGRIYASFGLSKAAKVSAGVEKTALNVLLQQRFAVAYQFGDEARTCSDLAGLMGDIESGRIELHKLFCRHPGWVAARLWEKALENMTDMAAALRWWAERWELLGRPRLVPSKAWDPVPADALRQAISEALEHDPGLNDWANERARICREMELTAGRELGSFESYVPSVPTTLIERSLWLDDHRISRVLLEPFGASAQLLSLAHILVAELLAQASGPIPHPLAHQLFGLASERPELLATILLSLSVRPRLLADLLLWPKTCPLACLQIARFKMRSNLWDRALTERDDQAAKAIALADAFSILEHHLGRDEIDPAEVAALLEQLCQDRQTDRASTSPDGISPTTRLCEIIACRPEAFVREVIQTLAEPAHGLGSASFIAVIELISSAGLVEKINADALLQSYTHSINSGEYALTARGLTVSAAASLVRLGQRARPAIQEAFLQPIPINERLAAIKPDENPFTFQDNIARGLRAHARVLCRAIAGMRHAPQAVLDALCTVLRSGQLISNKDIGIAAFSARFEARPFQDNDHSIVIDLAAALSVLQGRELNRLLNAILEIREPAILAPLLRRAPMSARSRIERRVSSLTPSIAWPIHSVTEEHLRIEALLSEGFADPAAHFVEDELATKTLGKVPGRDLARLRFSLRLKLNQRDWAGIQASAVPESLSQIEHPAAAETVSFHKALAALLDPSGNRTFAEQVFNQLHRSRPEVAAYATNLLAARIALLLDGNLFEVLDGERRMRGRQILVDADQAARSLSSPSAVDIDVASCNRALLLLALGEPVHALDHLNAVSLGTYRVTAAAFRAIALARLGRRREAIAVLDEAREAQGDNSIIDAARTHLATGRAIEASMPLTTESAVVWKTKAALFDLKQMDPVSQAAVMLPEPGVLEDLLTGLVRTAVAELSAQVPALRGIKTNPHENDLTSLLTGFLKPSMSHIGWSVGEQSRGGTTASANPGLRDLTFTKDGTVYGLLEAVKCNRPVSQRWMRDELTSHFQKLPSYATCSVMYHVTYAYIEEPHSVLEYLERTVKHDAPDGLTFVSCASFDLSELQSFGLKARFRTRSGSELTVIFFVLDMRQQDQLEAAMLADATNPRRKRPK